jgi:ketosteroid isomerase-like protein
MSRVARPRFRHAFLAALLIAIAPRAGAQAAPPSQRLVDARTALVQAERGAARHSAEHGVGAAIAEAAREDVTLLVGGAPLVRDRASAVALVDAQPALRGARVQWQPLHVELSRDSTLGVTWGVLVDAPPSGALRIGRYLAGWRRDAAGAWRLASMLWLAPVVHPDSVVLPASLVRGTFSTDARAGRFDARDVPARAMGIATTERGFAARAATVGLARAFHEHAAEDATIFGGAGELVRGPAAIRDAIAPPPGAPATTVDWWPVLAEASEDGTLGWTISEGEARAPGRPVAPMKYMTIWRRTEAGYRFVSDGGNARGGL